MNPHTTPAVDEVGRLVIHLPDDATFYGARSYLPIALDLVAGVKTPSLLRADLQGVNYMAQYEVFSALCSDRAQRTVDQTLLVGGQPTKPERYLGLWRDAIAASVSAESAAEEHGIRVVAVLQAPLAAMASAKQMDLTGDGAFTLELDLARPGAARDAYYGASMICTVLRREPAALRACIELRKTTAGRPGKASLFASAET
jgi:hypothetical protein